MSKANLTYNRFTKSYHLRNSPLSFHKDSQRLPFLGKTVALTNTVYALVTRKSLLKAKNKEAVSVPIVYTRFPTLQLLKIRLKELF